MLDEVFRPKAIAVVGANPENTFGGRSLRYLEQLRYSGAVYPVNPNYQEIRGWQCYADVSRIPKDVDVAVVAVPARVIPGLMEPLAAKGCRVAVVLSAGFSESSPAGRVLEEEMLARASRVGLRVIGPNCNGAINVMDRIPLGCASVMDRSELLTGPVALVSQSGSTGASFVDLAMSQGVGFSYVVAIGNANDLDATDFIRLFLRDPSTSTVALLIEGVKDGRAFLAALRELSEAGKQALVLKVGRSESGAASAATHTGALAGSWDVFRQLVEEAGGVIADTIEDLVAACAAQVAFGKVHAQQQWGGRLQVLSTSGMLCGLIADTIEKVTGLELAQPTEATAALLRTFGFAPPFNPLDFARVPMPEDRWAGNYTTIADALLADPQVDGLLVGSGVSHIVSDVARLTAEASQRHLDKLTAIYSLGGELVQPARQIAQGRVTTGDNLGALLMAMSQRSAIRRATSGKTLHTTAPPTATFDVETEYGVLAYLQMAGLQTVRMMLATSAVDAVNAAREVGYPVVIKAAVAGVVHKARLGLVRTALASDDAVRRAFAAVETAAVESNVWRGEVLVAEYLSLAGAREILLGARRDPMLGMHCVVGAGGERAEELADWVALSLACSTETIGRALARLRILSAVNLEDTEPLSDAVSRFGKAVVAIENSILALELNPIVFWPGQEPIVLDARVELAPLAGQGMPHV